MRVKTVTLHVLKASYNEYILFPKLLKKKKL